MNDTEWAALQGTWERLGYSVDGKMPDRFKDEDFQFAIRAILESWCKKVVGEGAAALMPVWAAYPERKRSWMDRQRRILEHSVEGIEGIDTWMNLMWQQATGDSGLCCRTAGKDPVQQEPPQTQDLLELVKTGTPEQIETTLRRGAKVLVKDYAGRTPLMHAAGWNPNPGVISLLIEAGLAIDASASEGPNPPLGLMGSESGWTALTYAAVNNPNPDVVRVLLKAGANLHTRMIHEHHRLAHGQTPLMLAAGHNSNPDVIVALLHAGAKAEECNEVGRTALMYAAGFNPNHEIITALTKTTKNVDDRDEDGMTPLMYATGYNANPKVALALLKAGANVRVKSLEGKTAFDYAAKNQKLKGTDVYRELFNAAL